jgi:hypothetical protein
VCSAFHSAPVEFAIGARGRITPQSKGTLEYLSRRIPVAFGHGMAMVLIIIFSVGKIDRKLE